MRHILGGRVQARAQECKSCKGKHLNHKHVLQEAIAIYSSNTKKKLTFRLQAYSVTSQHIQLASLVEGVEHQDHPSPDLLPSQ